MEDFINENLHVLTKMIKDIFFRKIYARRIYLFEMSHITHINFHSLKSYFST